MEFNLTAKDKHALKSLSADLRNMLKMKQVDDQVEDPEYRRVFDASFLKTVERNYLDEMLNWVEDFSKRMAEAESKQSKEELDLETKDLFDAGWLIEQNKNDRNG
jgi:hypothetical protein